MWDAIKALFGSKKFLGMVVGVLLTLFGKIGFGITEEQTWGVVLLVASFITGQGLADLGKEKAKVEADK